MHDKNADNTSAQTALKRVTKKETENKKQKRRTKIGKQKKINGEF
jgi:hypothetical protein